MNPYMMGVPIQHQPQYLSNVDPVFEQKREILKRAYLSYLEDFLEQGMCKDPVALSKFHNMRKILLGHIM
jgi:hypothetical protein